jgi:hypothetical protein
VAPFCPRGRLADLERAIEAASGRPRELAILAAPEAVVTAADARRAISAVHDAGRVADLALDKFAIHIDPTARRASAAGYVVTAIDSACRALPNNADRALFREATGDDFDELFSRCGPQPRDDFPRIDPLDFAAWPLWPYGVSPDWWRIAS